MKWALLLGLFFLVACTTQTLTECETDADCVPEQCCHPNSCINIDEKQDCGQTFCTLDCKPETLDCGQGSCLCQEGKCNAVYK